VSAVSHAAFGVLVSGTLFIGWLKKWPLAIVVLPIRAKFNVIIVIQGGSWLKS
jgi:hypothetical protein